MNTSSIVQKLWNYCNVLRDDGMSYGDYPGSSPGQADNEAAPAHPCARGIRTSLFSTVDVFAVPQDGRRACLRVARKQAHPGTDQYPGARAKFSLMFASAEFLPG